MSASERRLRRRRKVEKIVTYDSFDSDDQSQDDGKIPTNGDFQSASLSSDTGEHVITKNKPKRRILRKTNDFQNLNPSTQLDDQDSKITTTKVKKSKKVTHLPKICDIEEEYEILQTNMKIRKKHKQNISVTSIKEDMCSTTSKSDTDTSVPGESQVPSNDLENKQTKTKRKNRRRRNRVCKIVKSSSTICTNENESSVDTCASDVTSKLSDLSDSKGQGKNGYLDGKSSSDSDSIVVNLRNRKRPALAKTTVENIISSKVTPDKSDDSVEYNYKRKKGKAIQKCTELEEGKEFAVELSNNATETRQQKHLKQGLTELTGTKGTKTFGEILESKLACQNDDFQSKRTRKSIMKSGVTLNNRGVIDAMASSSKRRKNKSKLVQFQQTESLNDEYEDLNEKNNTYELDKSKNDISILKTVVVESNDCIGDLNEKNNTYELDKSKKDILILKTGMAENNECFEDATDELKASTNLRRREVELHGPPSLKLSNEANSSNRRKRSELDNITDWNVLASGEKTRLSDNVDSSFKKNCSNSDAKPSNEPQPSNRRRTFDLEESATDLIALKLASGENTLLNDICHSGFKENFLNSDGPVKTRKNTPGSNTPFSRVTRRKKVKPKTNNVKVFDNTSPPESSSLPNTTDDSSAEEPLNCNKSTTKTLEEAISSFSRRSGALSQSDQNLSSFGVSSTPLPKREGTYTVLNIPSNSKKMPLTSKEGVLLTSQSSTNKPSSRRKMPNFALIHKKAFEKMEDIGQLQQRKAERAKLLLSGAKPAVGFKFDSPRKIQNPNILKPLNFGAKSLKYSGVNESPKPLRNIVLQNACRNSPKLSRATHQSVKYSGVNESPKLLHNLQNNLLNSPKILRSNDPVVADSPKAPKSRVQSPKFVNPPNVKSNLQGTKVKTNIVLKLNQDTRENPNKFKPTQLGKNTNCYGASMKIHKPVIQENGAKHNIPTLLSTGITRYGFKTTSNPAKIITKQEQLKAVANKNNIVRNNVDERRNNIKGVRSNRRFELLMQMRNKSKSAN